MLLKELLQRRGAKDLVVRDHLDQASQIGKQVALIPVGQHSWHSGVVKLDFLVMDLDKVNLGVVLNQRHKCRLDSSRNLALSKLALCSISSGKGGAYLMVIDKDDNGGFPSHLLNSVKISQSIYLIQSTIDANTGAGSPVPHGTVGLALELAPPALSPLLEERLLICITPDIIFGLAGLAPGGRLDGGIDAEDAVAGSAHTVSPFVLAGSLVVSSISDDALDASGAAAVERGRGELDLSGASASEAIHSRHAHSGVDLVVAKGVFLVEVFDIPKIGVVAVFRVESLAMGVLGD